MAEHECLVDEVQKLFEDESEYAQIKGTSKSKQVGGRSFESDRPRKEVLWGHDVLQSTVSSTGPVQLKHAKRALSLQYKIAYALPHVALSAMYLPTHIHIAKFYTDTLLVPAGTLAIGTAIARAADAIIDPMIGWLSDHTSSRWGRRMPFIAASIPINAICYYLLFSPPAHISSAAAGQWFCFFFFMYLAVPLSLPLWSLGPELTTDNVERVSLFTWAEAFDKVGVILASALPSVLIVAFDGDTKAAFSSTALAVSTISVLTFSVLLYVIKEPVRCSDVDGVALSSNLVPGIRRSLRNTAFKILLVSAAFGAVSHSITNTLIAYFVADVLQVPDSDVWISKALLVFFVSSGVSLPFWQWLSHRFDSRTAWLTGWSLHIPSTFAMFFLRPGDTAYFLFLSAITGTCYGSSFLCRAMMSDTIDYDEIITGRRREAQYLAWISLIPKLAVIPASALPLLVLDSTGYDPAVHVQAPSVQFALRTLMTLVPCALSSITFVVAYQYPITGNVLKDIHILVHSARAETAEHSRRMRAMTLESATAEKTSYSSSSSSSSHAGDHASLLGAGTSDVGDSRECPRDPVLGGPLIHEPYGECGPASEFGWFLDNFSTWELYELAGTPFALGWRSVSHSMLTYLCSYIAICIAAVVCILRPQIEASYVVLSALYQFKSQQHCQLKARFHEILRQRHE